jgi:predicted nucleic acid-binding protein
VSVFVDTSALFAVLAADDEAHPAAAREWRRLMEGDALLETTSYVLVETHALVQVRLGFEAVRVLVRDFVPLLHVVWVEAEIHAAGVSAVLAAGRRSLSLVDCTSFEVMRRRSLARAFAIDRHFAEQGFDVIPGDLGLSRERAP